MASVDLAPQEARPAYRSGALDVSAGTCTFSWENRSALFERAVLPLSDLQFEAGLGDVACRLDDAAAGLVESWADGAAWAQVKDATSLDHGDLIRLFRRTLDVLKTAANLDPALAPPAFAAVRSAARAAATAVDRPPVRDDQFDAIFVRDDDDGDGEDDPKDP